MVCTTEKSLHFECFQHNYQYHHHHLRQWHIWKITMPFYRTRSRTSESQAPYVDLESVSRSGDNWKNRRHKLVTRYSVPVLLPKSTHNWVISSKSDQVLKAQYISYLSRCCDKIPDTSNFQEEGFISGNHLGDVAHRGGKVWRQDQEAAGHIAA